MKKLFLLFFISLVAFLFGSNAFAADGDIDISGKIVPPNCSISIEGTDGTDINFGDDIAWTDIVTSFPYHVEKFYKIVVLKLTGCTTKYNHKLYASFLGEPDSTYDPTNFANSAGDDYAKDLTFIILSYDSKNKAENNSGNIEQVSPSSNIAFKDRNSSTGEGFIFLRVAFWAKNRTPSTGLIKVPVSVALYIP